MSYATTFTQVAHTLDVPQLMGEQFKCLTHTCDGWGRLVVQDEGAAGVQHREGTTIRPDRPYRLIAGVASAVAHDDDAPIVGVSLGVGANEVDTRLTRLVMGARRGHDGEGHG